MDDRMLRSQLRRGPWVPGSDLNNVFRQLDSVQTIPGGAADDLYPTPQSQDLWLRGLANGDFKEGPPDSTLPIDDITNKLPGWSFVTVQGTSVKAYWDADATQPGGGVIRFDVAAGTLNDEAYLIQDAQVSGSPSDGRVNWPVFTIITRTGTVGTIRSYASYVKADRSTLTGTAQTNTYTSTGRKEMALGYVTTPSDATYLRFRFGVYRNITDSNTGSIVFSEAVLVRGQSRTLIPDTSPTGSYDVGALYRTSGQVFLDPQIGSTGGGILAIPSDYPVVRVSDGLELPLHLYPGPLSDPDGTLQPVIGSAAGSGFLWAAEDGTLWFRWTPDGVTITDSQVGSGSSSVTFQGARVYRTAAQSISDSTDTAVTFPTASSSEPYDTDTFHDGASNTSRMTIPEDGKYHIDAGVEWQSNATGVRAMWLAKNGAATEYAKDRELNPTAGAQAHTQLSTDLDLVAGDYLEVMVRQNSGGALNVNGADRNTYFNIHRLGGITGATGAAGSSGTTLLTLTEVEKDLGSQPITAGTFDITGLSGLTAGKQVLVSQKAAAYTGKGSYYDEPEMDHIDATGYCVDAPTIRVYWNSPTLVAGYVKFGYQVSS